MGDQPPLPSDPHFYTKNLGNVLLPSRRLVGIPGRAGEAQEGPRVLVPCEGYGSPRGPAASGGGVGLGDQDLNGSWGGQEGKRSRKRQVMDPWALGLG